MLSAETHLVGQRTLSVSLLRASASGDAIKATLPLLPFWCRVFGFHAPKGVLRLQHQVLGKSRRHPVCGSLLFGLWGGLESETIYSAILLRSLSPGVFFSPELSAKFNKMSFISRLSCRKKKILHFTSCDNEIPQKFYVQEVTWSRKPFSFFLTYYRVMIVVSTTSHWLIFFKFINILLSVCFLPGNEPLAPDCFIHWGFTYVCCLKSLWGKVLGESLTL